MLVATTDPPDSGRVAFQAAGDVLDRFAGGDSQDDPGLLDLEPGQPPAAGDGLKDREICRGEGQGTRLSATHGATSATQVGLLLQHTHYPEYLARLPGRATSKVAADGFTLACRQQHCCRQAA